MRPQLHVEQLRVSVNPDATRYGVGNAGGHALASEPERMTHLRSSPGLRRQTSPVPHPLPTDFGEHVRPAVSGGGFMGIVVTEQGVVVGKIGRGVKVTFEPAGMAAMSLVQVAPPAAVVVQLLAP